MTVGFHSALLRQDTELVTHDGRAETLAVDRWHELDEVDEDMVAHCVAPVIDLGCGPGRLVAELSARGLAVLGVDHSPVAVELTNAKGGSALCRNVFATLPGEGRWRGALLADGNIGIGGNPVQLLRRVRELLAPQGRVIVEVERPGSGLRMERVRTRGGGHSSDWFTWAWVGAEVIGELAAEAGFSLLCSHERNGRWFVALAC